MRLERHAAAREEPEQLVATERPVAAEHEQRLGRPLRHLPELGSGIVSFAAGTRVHGPTGRRLSSTA